MATITSLANSVVWLFAPTFEAIHSLGDEFCIPPPPPRQCLSSAAPSLTRITFLWQFYPVTRVGTQAGCRTVFSRERRSASGTKWGTAATPASSWRATRCSRARPAWRTEPPGIFLSPSAEVKKVPSLLLQHGATKGDLTGCLGLGRTSWSVSLI